MKFMVAPKLTKALVCTFCVVYPKCNWNVFKGGSLVARYKIPVLLLTLQANRGYTFL